MEPRVPQENRALDGRGTQVPGALGVLLCGLCLHSRPGSSLAVEGLSSVYWLVPCSGPVRMMGPGQAFHRLD